MAGSTQGARIEVEFDTTGASKVTSDLNKLGGQIDDTGRKSQGFWKGAIAAGTGFLGAQIFSQAASGVMNFGRSMVTGASDTREALSKVNVVFGDSAGAVTSWADTAAQSFGISRVAALDTAGAMGNLFTNLGFGRDVAAGMSTQFLGLAGDMSSFFNVSSPEVINAMTSAFVGEYDSLQRLGVPINAAAVEQYALNEGIWDGNGALTEQQRVLAVQGLLWENTANAQGDYARTSGELANQTRTLSSMFANITATMGGALLPAAKLVTGWAIEALSIFGRVASSTNRFETALSELHNVLFKAFGRQTATQIMGFVRGMISGFQQFLGVARQVAGIVGGFLADAFGMLGDNLDLVIAGAKGIAVAIGAFLAWGAITGIVTGLAAAIGLLFSPIMLIIGAAALLGIAWSKNWGDIQGKTAAVVDWFTGTAWPAIQGFVQNVMDAFSANGLSGAIASVLSQLQAINIGSILVTIGGWVISTLVDLGTALWDWVTGVALPAIGSFIGNIGSIAVMIGGWVISAASSLWDSVKSWIMGGGSGGSGDGSGMYGGGGGAAAISIGDVAAKIAGWVITAAISIAQAIKDWLPASVIVPLSSWTLTIGLPAIYLVGWNIVDAILGKLTDITVSLTEWTATLDGGQIVMGAFDIAGAISSKLAESPIKATLAGAAITLAVMGAPFILFGAIGAVIVKAFIAAMPPQVAVSAAGLVIALRGFAIELLTLLTEVEDAVGKILNTAIIDVTTIGINILGATISFGFDLLDAITLKAISLLPSGGIDLPISFNIPNPFDGGDSSEQRTPSRSGGGGKGYELPGLSTPKLPSLDFAGLSEEAASAGKSVGEAFARGAAEGLTGAAPTIGAAGGSAFTTAAGLANVAAVMGGLAAGLAFANAAGNGVLMGQGSLSGAIVATVGLANNLGKVTATLQGLSLGMAFVNSSSNGVRSAQGTLTGAVTSVLQTAANMGRVVFTLAGLGIGIAFSNSTANGIRSGGGSIGGAVSSLVGIALGYRGAMAGAGQSVGAALGQGIAAGIRSQIGSIAAAAASAVTAAIGAARSAGGINSPSKVMRLQVGNMLGLGAALGVEDMYPRMGRAMEGLISTPSLGTFSGAASGLNGPQSAFAGSAATSSPTYVTQNFLIAMPSEEWLEVVRNSEAGKMAPERVAALMRKAKSITGNN